MTLTASGPAFGPYDIAIIGGRVDVIDTFERVAPAAPGWWA